MEFGGRVSFNLSGVDFAFCALHTWNKTPALSYSLSEKYTLSVVGNYRRMTMLGGDLSIPVGNFGTFPLNFCKKAERIFF